MPTTLIEITRNLISDDNTDPAKRVFTDEELVEALKSYLQVHKQVKLQNLDGMNKRFESGIQWWMDGVPSHFSQDETQQFKFESVVFRGNERAVVPVTEYVVDVLTGSVIFTVAQTEPIYATFYSSNPYHAGADNYESLAAKKGRSALGVQLGSLSVNLTKSSESISKIVERLRTQGGIITGMRTRPDRPGRRAHPSDTRL